MKKCTKCKKEKDITEFYFRIDRNSYISVCNSCRKGDVDIYYNNKKEYHRQRAKSIYNANRERSLIKDYTKTDKMKNLNCDLTIEWMKENITSKSCIYCGETNQIGCDRIDNNKGHTKDNVVPCCTTCNMAKGNRFSSKEMIDFIGPAIRSAIESRNL
jgi:hypothetical protein